MSQEIVITDISVPAGAFALGRILTDYTGVEIELERIVPTQERIIPLLWVSGADPAPVRQTLLDDPIVDEATVLTETGGRTLFEVHWSPDVNSIVKPVIESNARVLRATGTQDHWELRLQFNSRDDLAHFRERCHDHDVEIHLRRLFNPTWPDPGQTLTSEQKDVILTAYENGFFEVPRETTLTEIAELIGISTNSASQRLRRGLSQVIREVLVEPPELLRETRSE